MELRSFFHRDVSTRVSIRTQTQDKLQEANYFRHQMKVAGGNRDHFRWNLSAFLGAAYSVLDIMHTEYTRLKRPGFEAWFKQKKKELYDDPLVSTLLNKRNQVVHVEVAQVRGRHLAEINEQLAEFEEKAVPVVTDVDGTAISGSPAGNDAPRVPVTPGISQFIWTVEEFPNRDVLAVAGEMLTALQRMVQECTQRFG